MSNATDPIAFVRGPFLQGTFLQLYMNGLYTGIFFVTLYGMEADLRTTPGLFIALIMMYILATVHVIENWILMKRGFIDNGDTAESTAIYLFEGAPLWLAVMGAVVFAVNTLIADFVLVPRNLEMLDNLEQQLDDDHATYPLYTDWSGSHIALGFKDIQEQASIILNPDADVTYIDFATPYISLSLTTTCLATILIIYRIIMMSDRSTRSARGYTVLLRPFIHWVSRVTAKVHWIRSSPSGHHIKLPYKFSELPSRKFWSSPVTG
ncbi:hypothetical protein FB45DRAFT_868024 [Roridomyces roridus]|uniref:Uncharacterized protein n=1 Tax=Roridomyces roridus TaxID=1738132 RepID=A0AAD7FNM7_9AGAR|nr:hypothetical protein FB45DRAFT_868024 [Roridomyces roridus]